MAIYTVPDRDGYGELARIQPPFKSKAVKDGKLFRRKHGFKSTEIAAGDEGVIILTVPYNKARINEVEFVNAREGDTVKFKVHDTSTGTISATLAATNYTAIPDLMLNQFGFDVELPNGFYHDTSNYDAALIGDMKIKIFYKNNGTTPHIIRGNITYHEVK